MTTQLTTLERIIKELKELNEFDGETVEYLLREIGYEDYILRHLMMKESISEIEYHYAERINYEKDNNIIIKHPLLHRLDMIKDDINAIKTFIEVQNLDDEFGRPTHCADSCHTHFSNIEIACDINNDEVYKWGKFNKYEENPEAHCLKNEWRDIRNFTCESKRLCNLVWDEANNYTRKHFLNTFDVKTIDLILIIHEVWNDIENNDTLTFNNFEDYWKFFIANRNKVLSL